jgi:hypothetical protein
MKLGNSGGGCVVALKAADDATICAATELCDVAWEEGLTGGGGISEGCL